MHAAFGGPGGRQPGSHTPRTLNSLSAIAGHEGDEEEWEHEMRGFRNEDEVRYRSLQLAIVSQPPCSTQACPFPITATVLRTPRLPLRRFLPTMLVGSRMSRHRLPDLRAAFGDTNPSITLREPLACGGSRVV